MTLRLPATRNATAVWRRPQRVAQSRFEANRRLPYVRHAAAEDKQPSIEELAQELVLRNPEAAASMERVGDAARRVAELQAEQARLAQQIAEEAAERVATLRAEERLQDTNLAAAEVVAAEKLLQAAQLQAEGAEAQRRQLEWQLAQDADRVESGKAGGVAGAAGTLASLPFLLSEYGTGAEAVLGLAGLAASCLLFGVTYRYAVRQDLDRGHLKGGVVAAFGLVRGIPQATDLLLAASPTKDSFNFAAALAALPQAALLVGEAVLAFAFASAALEFAFRQGLVKPLSGSTIQ